MSRLTSKHFLHAKFVLLSTLVVFCIFGGITGNSSFQAFAHVDEYDVEYFSQSDKTIVHSHVSIFESFDIYGTLYDDNSDGNNNDNSQSGTKTNTLTTTSKHTTVFINDGDYSLSKQQLDYAVEYVTDQIQDNALLLTRNFMKSFSVLESFDISPITSNIVSPMAYADTDNIQSSQPSDDAIPWSDDAIPWSDDAIPWSDDAIPWSDDAIPWSDDAIPWSDDAIPWSDDAIPWSDDAIPWSDDAIPWSDDAIPWSDDIYYFFTESFTEIGDIRINSDGTISASLVNMLVLTSLLPVSFVVFVGRYNVKFNTLEKNIYIDRNSTLKKSLTMFFVIILLSSSVPMLNFSNPSAMFGETEMLPEAYAQVDSTPPEFSSSALNNGTGTFDITFDEIINHSTIIPTAIHIRENNTSIGGITLSASELSTTANSDTISFTLNSTHLDLVNALNTPTLYIDTDAVQDISGNDFVGSAFDVTSASFTAGDFFSVRSQETAPTGLAFSPNGTKMFVIGYDSGGNVFEYNLSVPFDVTSASFTAGDSFSIAAQDSIPAGLVFSPNGTKMFVVGFDGGNVFEYALSIPFDVTSAFFTTGDSFSVATQDANPFGLAFSSNGTKMFVVGSNSNRVHEYTLSIPFDVTSASFTAGDSFSVSAQETTPYGLAFSPDGTKMFVVGSNSNRVHEYTLSIPFDVTSASFTAGDSFSVSAQETTPYGLTFSPDGTKMFVVGDSSDRVHEYNLSTAYNITLIATTPPEFSSSALHVITRIFNITFDEIIDHSTIIPTAIHIRESNSAGGITLSASELSTTANSDTISFTLSSAHLDLVNALNTPTLYIDAAAVQDIDGDDFVGLGFDVTSANVTTGNSFSVVTQDANPQGLAFSPDGTKMFVVGFDSDRVHEYALSIPFDVTSANVTTGNSFSVDTQDANPFDLAFSPDGTKMFVVGFSKRVHEYTLSIPFDVTSASFTAGDSFSVNAQETAPTGLAFSTNGTKMFVTGRVSDSVHEYTLSIPFDVTSASFTAGDSFPVNNQDNFPTSLAFSPDGTKMFVVGRGNSVHEYTLSIPFDVTSASFTTGNSFPVNNQDTSPTGLAFSPDGTKMFVLGSGSDRVYEYTISTAYNIILIGNPKVFSIESLSLSDTAGIMSDNTLHLTESLSLSDTIRLIDLSPPEFSSATLNQRTVTFDITFDETINHSTIIPTAIHIRESNSTGGITLSASELSTTANSDTISFTLNSTHLDLVNALDTPTLYIDAAAVQDIDGNNFAGSAFDVTTASFTTGNSFSVSAQETIPIGLAFSTDGTKMFVVGVISDRVHEYTLSIPFDVTSASFAASFSVSAQDADPSGLTFSPNGTKMFVTGRVSDSVHEYTLSIPFDVTSASFTAGNSFSVFDQEGEPTGLAFSPNGTKMFVVGFDSDRVHEYNLSIPFDVTTASYDVSFSVATQEIYPFGLAFSTDGTKMFVLGRIGDRVHEYNLSIPFDVTTASFTTGNSFSVSAQDSDPTGLAFSPDGTKMFVTGYDGDSVHEYNLSTAYTITVIEIPIDSTFGNNVGFDDTTPWIEDLSFQYRRVFTIDADNVPGSSNLADFAVMISLNATQGFDTIMQSHMNNDGSDLRFADNLGNLLPYEIEQYDESANQMIVWVKSNSTGISSSIDTSIYMYYGNFAAIPAADSTSVWNNGYEAVYHMNGITTGSNTVRDSTSNANHGNIVGTLSLGSAGGKLGTAIDFPGTATNRVDIGANTFPTGTSDRTVSAWIETDSITGGHAYSVSYGNDAVDQAIFLGRNSQTLSAGGFSNDLTLNNFWTVNNYQLVTLTFDGATANMYVGGILVTSDAKSWVTGDTSIAYIGSQVTGGEFWDGHIDEVRISNQVLSADWLRTEFNNQNSPSTFYDVGDEIKLGTIFDTVTLADTVVGTLSYAEIPLTESLSLSDTASIMSNNMLHLTESLLLDDTAGIMSNNMLHLTESLSLSDTAGIMSNNMLHLTESLLLDDDISVLAFKLVQPTESLSLSDTAGIMSNNMLHLTESLSLSDNIRIQIPIDSTFGNNVGFDDTAPWIEDLSFQYRRVFTIDADNVPGSSNLADFAVMISLNATQGFDTIMQSHMNNDGSDLRFADNLGNLLPYEIEQYDESANQMIVWVKSNSTGISSSIDTSIYMYYGNFAATSAADSTSVWNDDYKAVYHMNGITTGSNTVRDSTSNANHGNIVGTLSLGSAGGKLGTAIDFPGTATNRVDIGANTFPTGTSNRTISAWIETDSITGGHAYSVSYGSAAADQAIFLGRNSQTLSAGGFGNDLTLNNFWTVNNYQLVTLTFDGATVNMYVGGILVTSDAKSWDTGDTSIAYIGSQVTGGEFWDGHIDEVRISNQVLSADWLRTEFNNQNSPSTFYDISDEIKLGTIFDTVTLADTVVGTIAYTEIHLTESLLLDDDISVLAFKLVQPTESLSLSDTAGIMSNNMLHLTESLSLSDNIRIQIPIDSTFGNNVGFDDTAPWIEDLSFQYRRVFTIDADNVPGSSNLADFAVMISLNATQGFDTIMQSHMNNDGSDLRFADNLGNLLPYEIEQYDESANQMIVWVKSNSTGISSSIDTSIYMYYGNFAATSAADSTSVWNDDYKAVFHFDDNVDDSTINDNDGTNSGSINTGGLIGNGRDFDGINDRIYLPNTSLNFDGGDLTLSLWMNTDTTSGGHTLIGKSVDASHIDPYYRWILYQASNQYSMRIGATAQNLATAIPTDTWKYYVGAFDTASNEFKLYVDGNLIDTVSTDQELVQSSRQTTIGGRDTPDNNPNDESYDGQLDEVRISSAVKSAHWIKTEFNNQNSPSTFYDIGDEIKLGTIFDTVTLADTVINTIPHTEIPLTESLFLDDGISAIQSKLVQPTESLSLSDTVGIMSDNTLHLTESLSLSDTTHIIATTPPEFSSSALHVITRIFNITFDEIIDHSTIIPTAIHIRESNSAGGITLSASELSTTANSDTISFTLSSAHLDLVNALDTPTLYIDAAAVQDIDGDDFVGLGFDVTSANVTTGNSFSVVTQDANPQGLAFSPDGTKMFVVGFDGDRVHEYALSIPFDVTSANVTTGNSFSVDTQDANPFDLAFSPDGTKMFVVGFSKRVHEYTLSIPFDVTSASFTAGDSFSVNAQETAPTGLAFSPDGTKMFVTGRVSDSVHEYTLSIPFDVTSASFTAGDSFPVNNQDNFPTSLAFSPDGTKMFVVGRGNSVHEYTLSIPFDVTSASFTTGNSFPVNNQDTSPTGLAFSPDGTKMFVLGSGSDRVYEYTISTAYNIILIGNPKVFSTESLSLDDTVSAISSKLVQPTESLSLSDTAGIMSNNILQLTESLSLSDSVLSGKTIIKILELLLISDYTLSESILSDVSTSESTATLPYSQQTSIVELLNSDTSSSVPGSPHLVIDIAPLVPSSPSESSTGLTIEITTTRGDTTGVFSHRHGTLAVIKSTTDTSILGTTLVEFGVSGPTLNKIRASDYYAIDDTSGNIVDNTISMSYNDSLITELDIDESTLTIYKRSDVSGSNWIALSPISHDVTNNVIVANNIGFSTYTLGGSTSTTPTPPAPTQTNRGGGGGGGGGSSIRGPALESGQSAVLYEVSWDAINDDSTLLSIIAGPDSDAISIKIRTPESGVLYTQRAESQPYSDGDRVLYEATIKSSNDFVVVYVEAVSQRNVNVAQNLINLYDASGTVIITKYVHDDSSNDSSDVTPGETMQDQLETVASIDTPRIILDDLLKLLYITEYDGSNAIQYDYLTLQTVPDNYAKVYHNIDNQYTTAVSLINSQTGIMEIVLQVSHTDDKVNSARMVYLGNEVTIKVSAGADEILVDSASMIYDVAVPDGMSSNTLYTTMNLKSQIAQNDHNPFKSVMSHMSITNENTAEQLKYYTILQQQPKTDNIKSYSVSAMPDRYGDVDGANSDLNLILVLYEGDDDSTVSVRIAHMGGDTMTVLSENSSNVLPYTQSTEILLYNFVS